MKYKCIAKYVIEDSVVMNPGDIVVINDNQLYNITTGVDYNNISDVGSLKECLEAITDDPSVNYLNNSDRFKSIINEMYDIFIRKNHDYGNSFEESLNEEGLAASRIRMGDKWRRYITLSRGEKAKVNDESIRDTLIDLSNYCIMTVMWMDKHGNNKY